jgi:hypothetical protein
MVSLPTGMEAFFLIGLAAAVAAGIGALFALVVGRSERVEDPDVGATRPMADAPEEREADRAA